jgi:drug/metabolite transporter (DMT)-like permease
MAAVIGDQPQTQREPGSLTPLRTFGLLALALLWASAWLIEQFFPSDLPIPARLTLHNLTLAAASAPFALATLARNRAKLRPIAQLAIASILLLGLPTLLIDLARTAVSSITVTELFALFPIAVVVLTPHVTLGSQPAPDTTNLLVPAILGLAGILLLLPFALPTSPRRAAFQAVVVLAVLVSAVAAIWMHRLLAAFSVPQALLIATLANAAFALAWLLAASLIASTPILPAELTRQTLTLELALAFLDTLPQIALLLWLTRDLAPTRVSALYFAVPLLTVLEGLIFLPAGLTLKSVAGGALILFATWRLTTARTPTGEPRLILH